MQANKTSKTSESSISKNHYDRCSTKVICRDQLNNRKISPPVGGGAYSKIKTINIFKTIPKKYIRSRITKYLPRNQDCFGRAVMISSKQNQCGNHHPKNDRFLSNIQHASIHNHNWGTTIPAKKNQKKRKMPQKPETATKYHKTPQNLRKTKKNRKMPPPSRKQSQESK